MQFKLIGFSGLALGLLTALAAPALAADPAPVSTWSAADAPAPTPVAEPRALEEDRGAPPAEGPLRDDGKIHGSVSAGVGTHGYREGSVELNGPLPNGGFVALAVDASQMDSGRGERRDHAVQPAPAN